jgi:GNAT superfamily N-acetyltransferase
MVAIRAARVRRICQRPDASDRADWQAGRMDIAIRRGTAADARAAADLWLRARASAGASIPPPAHPPDEVRDWFASHVVPDCELWLAETPDGALAGILVLEGSWLEQLYVEPGLTGNGVGAALVGFAKARRPGGLRLWTFVSNERAQRFYERWGFEEVERTDGRDNEERSPDILFAWAGA